MPTKTKPQAKVEELGGVFIHANDPKSLAAWYQDKLGLELAHNDCDGGNYYCMLAHGAVFSINPAKKPLAGERNRFTVNFKVGDFDGILARLESKGVAVERTEDYDYGRFGWITDLEGNRIEFWQAK